MSLKTRASRSRVRLGDGLSWHSFGSAFACEGLEDARSMPATRVETLNVKVRRIHPAVSVQVTTTARVH